VTLLDNLKQLDSVNKVIEQKTTLIFPATPTLNLLYLKKKNIEVHEFKRISIE